MVLKIWIAKVIVHKKMKINNKNNFKKKMVIMKIIFIEFKKIIIIINLILKCLKFNILICQ